MPRQAKAKQPREAEAAESLPAAVSSSERKAKRSKPADATRASLFDRLADVELQSVLQWLDPRSLCLASACSQRLRIQSNQPFVFRRYESGAGDLMLGSFLLERPRPDAPAAKAQWSDSRMLRRWLPSLMDFDDVGSSRDLKHALREMDTFGHITRVANFNWLEMFGKQSMARVLRSPALQRLRELELSHFSVTEPVLSAACALPHLRYLTLDWSNQEEDEEEECVVSDDDDEGGEEDAEEEEAEAEATAEEDDEAQPVAESTRINDEVPESLLNGAVLSSAKALRRVDLVGAKKTAAAYAGLAAIPQLEILTLRDCAPLYSSLAELPKLFGLAKLRRLDLLNQDRDMDDFDPDKLASLLSQLPLLQHFRIAYGEFSMLLGALLSVGPLKLSVLTRVRWGDCQESASDWIPSLDFSRMNRVAAAFPHLRVCVGDVERAESDKVDDGDDTDADCCDEEEQACAGRIQLRCPDEPSLRESITVGPSAAPRSIAWRFQLGIGSSGGGWPGRKASAGQVPRTQ